MYKIAVVGDRDSVLGFKALGLEVCPAQSADEAREIIHRLAKENCASSRVSFSAIRTPSPPLSS